MPQTYFIFCALSFSKYHGSCLRNVKFYDSPSKSTRKFNFLKKMFCQGILSNTFYYVCRLRKTAWEKKTKENFYKYFLVNFKGFIGIFFLKNLKRLQKSVEKLENPQIPQSPENSEPCQRRSWYC